MALPLYALLAVAVFALVGVGLRRGNHHVDDVDRFHHAQEITSSWSASYAPDDALEEPEAYEHKPAMQSSVHLVDA